MSFSVRGRRWPAIAWTLFVLILLSIPSGSLAASELMGLDKVVHLTLFFVLTWLWLQAIANGSVLRSVLVVVAAIGFAFGSEWYQHFLPARSMDVFDGLADSLGAIAAWAVWGAETLWRRRRDKKAA